MDIDATGAIDITPAGATVCAVAHADPTGTAYLHRSVNLDFCQADGFLEMIIHPHGMHNYYWCLLHRGAGGYAGTFYHDTNNGRLVIGSCVLARR